MEIDCRNLHCIIFGCNVVLSAFVLIAPAICLFHCIDIMDIMSMSTDETDDICDHGKRRVLSRLKTDVVFMGSNESNFKTVNNVLVSHLPCIYIHCILDTPGPWQNRY